MLKIREYDDNGNKIDLKVLEKFGFRLINDLPFDYYFKKVYLKNDNDDRVCYTIDLFETREIRISRLDGELDDTLYDLIKADLVEKVGDNNE